MIFPGSPAPRGQVSWGLPAGLASPGWSRHRAGARRQVGTPRATDLGVLGHGAGFHRVDLPRSSLGGEKRQDPRAAADVKNNLREEGAVRTN